MNKATIWVALALTAALAAPVRAEDPTATTVVATVNGTEITLGTMLALREKLPQQYQALPDDVLFKGILDQLVQQTLLEQTMAGQETLRDTLNIANDRRAYLAQQAITPVVTAAVTDEAIKAAYDERVASLPPSVEYHAAHILVATEEEAKAIKAELDAGGNFADIAKAKSTDTGSGANGGDLGWFEPGMMVKPFEDAVIAAEIGKVTDPVQSDFGWHLILVQETRPLTPPTLEDMHDELAAAVEQKAVEDYLAKLGAEAKVERPGDALDPAILKDVTLLDK